MQVNIRDTLIAASFLLLSYIAARHMFFSLHGMKQFPALLFIFGLGIILLAGFLKARWVLITTPMAYALGIAAGMRFQTESLDQGGGLLSNNWIVWGAVFIAGILIGVIIDLVNNNERIWTG